MVFCSSYRNICVKFYFSIGKKFGLLSYRYWLLGGFIRMGKWWLRLFVVGLMCKNWC